MGDFGKNVGKMYVFRFLLSMHFIAGVLIPFFTEWGGISYAQVMLLQSYFVFAAFVLEVPTGAVADTISRKASLLLSAAVTAAAVVVYASTPHVAAFIVGETLWAAGHALASGASEALLYDSLQAAGRETESKRIFGRFGSMDLMALMVSAPLGGLFASHWGLRSTMLAMAVPFSIACLVVAALDEPPSRAHGHKASYIETLRSGITYFRGNAALRALAFDYVSIGPLIFFVLWAYQPLLTARGVPIAYFGFVHAGMCGAQIVVMNRFEACERIIGSKRRFVVASAVIPAGAFLAIAFTHSVPVLVAMLLLCCGFGLTRHTLFLSYFNKHIASDVRATVLSTMSMLYLVASGVLYPVMGVMVEWSLPRTFFALGMAILVLTGFSQAEESYLSD